MPSLRTQSKTVLNALAAMLLAASVAAAQVANSATVLTLNGSARILTGPNGGTALLLTTAQQSEAGSAFTTNSVVFGPKFIFSTFFQF